MEQTKKIIAIYPGSFNPFTTGHLNVSEKGIAIFGKENFIIAVGQNPEKGRAGTIPYLTIKQNLPNKIVESYSGFLTDYIYEKKGWF